MTDLLTVEGLSVRLPVSGEMRTVLDGVSFSLAPGEALGLVGESGSGKSMTVRSISRLLPTGAEVDGTVTFDGRDVYSLRGGQLRDYRHETAVVFQDPRAHTNPVRRIGDFMTETLRESVSRSQAKAQAVDMLGQVGIDDGERRLRQYPHELSGGMLQRVMIATALLTNPRLILADEPTTALDVTIQAEVMAIIDSLRKEFEVSLLFITHDLDLAAAVCDRTAVMYAGQLVELQRADALHDDPLSPLYRGAGRQPGPASATPSPGWRPSPAGRCRRSKRRPAARLRRAAATLRIAAEPPAPSFGGSPTAVCGVCGRRSCGGQ